MLIQPGRPLIQEDHAQQGIPHLHPGPTSPAPGQEPHSRGLPCPGIAVDKNGLMYFVDATMIRKVDQNGIISTLLGSNDLTAVRPLSCDSSMDVAQVGLSYFSSLRAIPGCWPGALTCGLFGLEVGQGVGVDTETAPRFVGRGLGQTRQHAGGGPCPPLKKGKRTRGKEKGRGKFCSEKWSW